MIVGICGKKRHGKNTIGDALVKDLGFRELQFSRPLKDACKLLFGFDDSQLDGDKKEVIDERWGVTPRRILQFVGTDLFRDKMKEIIPDIGSEFWIRSLKSQIKPNENIVITDIRFPNEAEMIRSVGGLILKVIRPSLDNDSNFAKILSYITGVENTKVEDAHESEKSIDLINADYTIPNVNTAEDLQKIAKSIISKKMRELHPLC